MKLSRAAVGLRTRHGAVAAVAAASIALAPFASPPAHAGTTVTSYQYNADGAMTAVTTQVDGGNASTEYLTWDNFVPDKSDPTTGTVYAGNGNLLAIGPKPGSGSSLFAFDNRDRLTGFSGADKSSAYGYHADGLMASSTAADKSGFGFYYAGSSMANLHQTDTDQWSARLGPVRYLDDGSEEVLLTPRKDVAATYDPSSNTLQSYDYDSFGAEAGAPLSSGYDLKDNPHRYAGAYRDPLWGGYYLQARWYDPDLGTFLSRDPMPGFHPYSYADGSPVMNTDPTGTSAKSVERGVAQFLNNAFVLPVTQLFTKQFWIDLGTNKNQLMLLTVFGVAAEVAMWQVEIGGITAYWRGLSNIRRGTYRFLSDAAVVNIQAGVTSAYDGNTAQNFEMAVTPLLAMAISRNAIGLGTRTHMLRAADVAERAMHLTDEETVLVFRARRANWAGKPEGWSSPIMESLRIGRYNEEIVEVTLRDFTSSAYVGGRSSHASSPRIRDGTPTSRGAVSTGSNGISDFHFTHDKFRFQYVGRYVKPPERPALAPLRSGRVEDSFGDSFGSLLDDKVYVSRPTTSRSVAGNAFTFTERPKNYVDMQVKFLRDTYGLE